MENFNNSRVGRSRERLQTGQLVLDSGAPANRLRVMKANYQNNNEMRGSSQEPFKSRKPYTLQNSPVRGPNMDGELEDRQSLEFIDDQRKKNNAGSTPFNRDRASSYSKVSVKTRDIEKVVNDQQQYQSLQPASMTLNPKLNHKRGYSNDYLEKLKFQQDEQHTAVDKSMRTTIHDNSPAARHYLQMYGKDNGFNNTQFNKKLKMKDTFTSIFPGYTHGTGTVYTNGMTHNTFIYPKQMDGKETFDIDRTYTKKMDYIKIYTEEILKIANMRRNTK